MSEWDALGRNWPLTLLISILALVLLGMIVSMLFSITLHDLECCCVQPHERLNYIDIGLYKTRHTMYRKEVYSHSMRVPCHKPKSTPDAPKNSVSFRLDDARSSPA